MEQFFNNPGFKHIGEIIFEHLDHKSLESCSKVCLDWKRLLNNPKFWLKICNKKAANFSTNVESKVLNDQWKNLILETENHPGGSMHYKFSI